MRVSELRTVVAAFEETASPMTNHATVSTRIVMTRAARVGRILRTESIPVRTLSIPP
jgi:hypothetical protein